MAMFLNLIPKNRPIFRGRGSQMEKYSNTVQKTARFFNRPIFGRVSRNQVFKPRPKKRRIFTRFLNGKVFKTRRRKIARFFGRGSRMTNYSNLVQKCLGGDEFRVSNLA